MVRFDFRQAPLIEIFVLDRRTGVVRDEGVSQEKLEFPLQWLYRAY
jgi:hypothetical protein